MSVSILVGSQWGDEGKGKVVDILSEKYEVVARYQGGANAGHTVEIGDRQFILHLIPSGILREDVTCVIGNGVVVDPQALLDEISFLEKNNIKIDGRLFISHNAHLIMPYHKLLDSISESGQNKIGTTGRGIGPCYIDKYARKGIRIVDLLNKDILERKIRENLAEKNNLLKKVYDHKELDVEAIIAEYMEFDKRIDKYVKDTPVFLNNAIAEGKSVLLEGAQGALLDIDHGTYPYVTSSSPTSGGACTGTGIPPTKIDSVIGIVKAYTTRVGLGPFPTELLDEDGEKLRKIGAEFGATTGRPRRCGWFDAFLVKYSTMVNGIDSAAITKLDVLSSFDEIKVCVGYEYKGKMLKAFPNDVDQLDCIKPVYETLPGWKSDISQARTYNDLPKATKDYLEFISSYCGFKISLISVGAKRAQTIVL
ncbi:MAG: adenylosuccinate synthase [Ignavibacteria bacterium]|jgi:adenylosuccinate synthase|nr:adenylosuccinate synthase [Ignavibacteria bacterium]MCU7511314.1 adenylosuccinate synthase [Ignavibacteria bacterium]MCU7518964.1 adenylosuccinate synthase [Ignavibacteria bacterium]MCU7523245.1 adenylosuccinate synthase [Ignavibacteria bacterium]